MKRFPAIAAALMLSLATLPAAAVPTVFSAIGNTPAHIATAVNDFRAALGTLNPNTPGSVGSGRREINWDGVPDAFSAPNAFPGDFFNGNTPGRARGVVFSTPGTGFQVSANAGNPTPILFDNLLTGSGGGSGNFQTFSPQRLFTALDSTITDVAFLIPGTATAALTRGFGVVFTDTDDGANSNTGIEFFDASNQSLGSFLAPADNNNQNLSFLGVDFGSAVVARARITSGRCALTAAGNDCLLDVVVMDDFIYGEPVAAAADAVPAPAALLLMGTALAGFAAMRRKG